jgi:hypothetical protein
LTGCVTPHVTVGPYTALRAVHTYAGVALSRRAVQNRAGFDGRYWARTSDLRLVEAALSQLS